jgi:hypothetical protein
MCLSVSQYFCLCPDRDSKREENDQSKFLSSRARVMSIFSEKTTDKTRAEHAEDFSGLKSPMLVLVEKVDLPKNRDLQSLNFGNLSRNLAYKPS